MEGPSIETPAVKVHYIKVPFIQHSTSALVVLAVGVVFSWLLACVILIAIGSGLLGFTKLRSPVYSSISFFLAFLGPVLWVYLFRRVRHRQSYLQSPGRSGRLARLGEQSDASNRLPHRVVEYALRIAFSNRQFCEIVRNVPSGHVIIAGESNADHLLPYRPTPISFEPVELVGDDDRIRALWEAHLEAQHRLEPLAKVKEMPPEIKPISAVRQVIGATLFFVFVVPGFCYVLYELLVGRISKENCFVLLALLFTLTNCLIPLIAERKWWLVPGGLIYRHYRAWRRALKIGLIRPSDSPLIVDMRRGTAFVKVNRRYRRIACPGLAAKVLVAGWISQARTPDTKEIEAFLGQRLS